MSRMFTLAFLLMAIPAVAQDADSQLSDFAAQLAPHEEGPGGVIAIIRNGEVAEVAAAGYANIEHRIPFTPETRTNIGSTSKQFTGYAIALLASRGELSVDDDVRDYIPELPEFEHVVTIRNLLTHTSGYREFLNSLIIAGRQMGDVISPHEVIDVVKRQAALQNAPGEVFNYNNSGYSFMATIIERVTGEDFEDWMRENVFLPAGMTETLVVGGDRRALSNSAQGYVRHPETGAFYYVPDIPASTGAGGIYTTPGDLARWIDFLFSEEQSAIREEMVTPFVLNDDESTGYGYGLFMGEYQGYIQIEHGGADTAHRSTFVVYPELDAAVVILTNHGAVPGSVLSEVVAAFLIERADDEEIEEVAPELLSIGDVLDDYLGEFALDVAPGFVLTFTREDDELIGQGTGQPPFATVATSDSTFTIVGVDAAVTFHREADGSVNHLTLHQNGDHRATRKDLEAPAGFDVAEFVGRYFSEEAETFYEIAVEDDDMVIVHRRFESGLSLSYTVNDTFASMALGFSLEFKRDEEGNVNGFHVNFGRSIGVWFEKQ